MLLRTSARQVLNRVLGQHPVGIKGALRHLPDVVLSRENYRRLVDLLADPEAAQVLHHADQLDDTAICVLADLPQKLRKPLAFALADWPRKLNGLTDSLVASIGGDGRVLGRQVASAGNDAASNGWQCSTAGSGRYGLFARQGVAELPC